MDNWALTFLKQAPPARLRDKAVELHQTSIRTSEPCQTNIMFSLGGGQIPASNCADLHW